jgi:DNA polymerase-3 subunit gamma/tau
LIAGAGHEGVGYERAVALLGVTDVSLIDDMVDALAAGDRATVFETVDRLVEAGHDPRRFAADLLQRLRDVTLLQAVPEAADRGLVEAADDELARMVEQAGRIGAATLTRYSEIVHSGLTEMRGATAPRLLLELLCARMLLPAATTAEPGLLERIERLERGGNAIAAGPRPADAVGVEAGSGPRFQRASTRGAQPEIARTTPPARAAEPGPARRPMHQDRAEPVPARAASAAPRDQQPPPQAGPPDAAAVRRAWPDILAFAKQRTKRTAALLVSATVGGVEDDTLVLSIATAPLARLLSEQSNTDVVAEALHAVLGVRWRVRCEHGTGASAATTPAAPARGEGRAPAVTPRRPPPTRRSTALVDGVPLPPEPEPEETPPDDDESMIAEAATATPAVRRDPEEAALELLTAELGARAIDPY